MMIGGKKFLDTLIKQENSKEIITKIQKLLKLAESQNEFESQSAILFARKLMAKHKLTMNDVDEKDQEAIECETEPMRSPWKRQLGNIIAKHFRCKSFLRTSRHSYKFVFLGLEEDVNIAKTVYEQVVNIINSNAKKHKSDKKSYALGFIIGLDEKLEEQSKTIKEASLKEYAIIAITPVPVINRFNEIEKGFAGIFKGKSARPDNFNHEDYLVGVVDGKNYNKDEQIDGVTLLEELKSLKKREHELFTRNNWILNEFSKSDRDKYQQVRKDIDKIEELNVFCKCDSCGKFDPTVSHRSMINGLYCDDCVLF